ncbi:SigE family RNA polymerase sigma factor [Dactylosporangium roseum]|uniref:SigE family RNA polymerase sigma factor n=1 Tax=Dactylosporangium roseum TaxID=47989 RepID=A0ABY5ZJB1_9ACTN|nr:SigE family RNA polymerase sigma factor [Dactylosporangium roseum]
MRQDAARRGFDDFVRAESDALIRSAYLLTGDRYHAEDLVQTALARAATRWHKIEEPRAYVYRILYTQSVSWWRRRRIRVVETLTGDVPERQAPAGPDLELAVVLRQALGRLTPRQRAVLVLRFYEDHSEAETAVRLGCRIGTVKSQTRHALDRLRRLAPELAELVNLKAEVGS